MKKTIRIMTYSILAAMVIAAGCKKDNEKVLNSITLAGNETSSLNQDYTPVMAYYNGPAEVQCVTTTYGMQIWISLAPASSIYIELILPSGTMTIPEGVIAPSAGECQTGFYVLFYPSSAKVYGLVITDGSITITRKESNYNIDLDLNIQQSSGGGVLKGNFNGPIDSPGSI